MRELGDTREHLDFPDCEFSKNKYSLISLMHWNVSGDLGNLELTFLSKIWFMRSWNFVFPSFGRGCGYNRRRQILKGLLGYCRTKLANHKALSFLNFAKSNRESAIETDMRIYTEVLERKVQLILI